VKLPLVYNARSGPSAKDPETLLARLPVGMRDRLEPVPLGPPWDYAPLIEAASAAGGPLLVWGGDGTLHHAGAALVRAGCPVALAAIPGGSGNGLARGLRTPLDPAGALMNLLHGRELSPDLPRLDGEPFLNLCGTGFEAAVARAFEAAPGRGFWNYLKLVGHLWGQVPEMQLRWDAETAHESGPATRLDRLRAAWRGPEPALPEQAWSLAFANLPQFGSGLWIAPGADPTDGLLQWVRLRRPSFFELLAEAPQLFREGGRTSLRQEGRLARATLRLYAPAPFLLDGEPAAARDRAELTLERAAFRMQVTCDCPWG